MKKIIIVVGIALIAVLFMSMRKAVDKSGQIRIALFTPTTHRALEEIEQGFKQTLQKLSQTSYAFTTFNANGNRTLLRAQAEEIISGNYDLIFTMGASCSQTIAELIRKKGIKLPHVFSAVDSREFAQSLKSLDSSTGVYVGLDYKKEMDILHQFKPMAKDILLVYDPSHGIGLEEYKKEIEEYIKKYGMALHSVEIYQTNEIQQKVVALLPNMDVVLVLVDNTVVSGIDALIALCNRYGVTLMASDLASGKKGAALAYGITEYESGCSAAHKAYEILMQGKTADELPISAITTFQLSVNRTTMMAQHVDIDNETLLKLEAQKEGAHDIYYSSDNC
jgi:putative tryptophan/tyrosine transport system substrate-binding protein